MKQAINKKAQSIMAERAKYVCTETGKAQHSPLPWNIGEDYDVFSANTDCVARVCGAPEGIKGDKANARLIVRAVNHAANLAEALRDCETTPGALAERSHEYALRRLATITETARTALAAYESEAQP